jgi:hypothetical protein
MSETVNGCGNSTVSGATRLKISSCSDTFRGLSRGNSEPPEPAGNGLTASRVRGSEKFGPCQRAKRGASQSLSESGVIFRIVLIHLGHPEDDRRFFGLARHWG